MSHVTRWLRLTQLKSHLAKIGGHYPSKGGDKAFFAYHVITWSMNHMTWWVRYPYPKVIVRATELNNKYIYVLQIGVSLLQIGTALFYY